MATIGQLLDRVQAGDCKAAIRLSDALRARGFNYADVAAFVRDRRGIDPREWEALLYEGDTGEE